MNRYCKIILNDLSRGVSLFDLCERPGMPSVYVVKQWLFNREYHHEFEGFRELWLQFQENYAMILCDTMSWNIKQLNNILRSRES